MDLQPLFDKVLIKPVAAEEQTKSGIILSQKQDRRTSRGTVLAIGNEVREVKIGDEVVFREYGPERVNVGDRELLVCQEEDIIAKVANSDHDDNDC